MIRISLFPILLGVGLALGVQAQQMADPTHAVIQQDGLLASLSAEDDDAKLVWRFTAPLPAPLDSVSFDVNGRQLPPPRIFPWPEGHQTATAVLAAIDTTQAETREEVIATDRARLVLLARALRPHHDIGFAALGSELALAVPEDDAPFDPFLASISLPVLAGEPDLGKTLRDAVAVLASSAAPRRALFVMTDGHSIPALDADSLGQEARAAGVSVNFVFNPSGRQADRSALERIVTASHGILVEGAAGDTFLEDPFRFIDSGAEAQLSLNGARRFPWEKQTVVTATFRYGENIAHASTTVDLPAASWNETASYLWHRHGAAALIAVAGVGWSLALGMALLLRRAGCRAKASVFAAKATRTPDATAEPESPPPPPDRASEQIVANDTEQSQILPESDAPGAEAGTRVDAEPDGKQPIVRADRDETAAKPVLDRQALAPPLSEPAPMPPATEQYSLRLLRRDGSPYPDIPLTEARYIIGRAEGCDIVLRDASVTDELAVLSLGDEGPSITAIKPGEGLLVNSEPVSATLLHGGDQLSFGTVRGMIVVDVIGTD